MTVPRGRLYCESTEEEIVPRRAIRSGPLAIVVIGGLLTAIVPARGDCFDGDFTFVDGPIRAFRRR